MVIEDSEWSWDVRAELSPTAPFEEGRQSKATTTSKAEASDVNTTEVSTPCWVGEDGQVEIERVTRRWSQREGRQEEGVMWP